MKTQPRFLTTILVFLFFSINSFGQIDFKCGTDEALRNNPELQKVLQNFENEYKLKKASQKKSRQANLVPDMTTVYTVPVVFHVYHLGEAVGTGSNVSDAAVQASVDRLNTVFRATGVHAGLTPDIKIQFVLASKTPNCDPTSGIVRVDGRSVSGYTNGVPFSDNTMQQALRNLSTWSTDHYINIRICHSITGAGGFASFLNDLFMPAGSVNTNTNQSGLDNFWAHEMGHSMNLYHTFQGDGTPNGGGTGTVAVCPVNTDPDNDGDKVSDTDPHKNNDQCDYAAINSCTGNAFGDILKNIMSYSCTEKFTPKQMERMRYALINYRANLINSKGITGLISPPVANSIDKCSSGSATLVASGCSGTYNWYATSSGGSSLGTGSSFTTPSLSSSTTYYVNCTETNTNCGASNRTPVSITITPAINISACNITATNGLSNYYGISNFSVGTITYTGSSTSQLGTNYQDNTCSKADLQAGNSYPFSLTGMFGNYMYGQIYIDYNNDGDFNDANETVFDNNNGWQSTHTGNIIPPNTALTNTYLRMRVMLDGSGASTMTPCTIPGASGYGSGLAVDFAVKILPATCINPSAPTTTSASRCGTGTVTLSASGCSGTYRWYSTNTETGTPLATTANYTTLSLTTTTTYYVECLVGSCTSTRSTATATINSSTTPVLTVSSVTINSGQTATIAANGCTSGTVNWFNNSTGGTSISTGVSFTTPALTTTTSYYAECLVNNCTSSTRGVGTVTVNQTTITLGTLAATNYCIGNTISVPFTTTLPAGTTFTATLKKGATIISNVSATNSPIGIFVPFNTSSIYGTDYTVQITSGTSSSSLSPNLTIGTITNRDIVDSNNNTIFSTDYLCSGSSKVYKAIVKDIYSNISNTAVSYQWSKDGTAISGATSQNLTVSQAGNYTFVATQAGCSVTSNSLVLSVNTSPNINTRIWGDPIICTGSAQTIESNYFSNTSGFQWYKDGVAIPSATNRQYSATQSGLYKVSVTDGTCSGVSFEQRLTFGTGLLATIYASGNDTTLCGGLSKYLYVPSNSFNPTQYTFQWQKDGVNIAGATSSSFSPTQTGVYTAIFSQGTCASTSRGITIVNSTQAQKPLITAGNISNICNGSIIINQNINENYSYLYGTWYKDGVITSTSTNYQYIATSTGSYKMINGSGTCANESNTVSVNIGSTFSPKIYIPAFYYGKTNLCGTGDYVFINFDNQNLTGGTYTYQWQKNGVSIAGEISRNLFVTTAGNYSLLVSNGSCLGTSNSVTITNNTPVTYITASENNIFCTNKIVRLDLKGANTYFFTPVIWRRNGAVISGETSSSIYTNIQGEYTATYNQNGCSGTSTVFNLNIGYPSFTAQSPSSINNGQTANLLVLGCVGTVNWYNVATGGTPISTNASFTTPILYSSTTYYSNCVVNGCMNPFRTTVPITVNCTNLYSLKTGIWDDLSVWSCGRLPINTDITTVKANHFITIPASYTANAKNIIFETGGKIIQAANTSKLCLSCPQIPTNGLMIHLPFNGNANDASGNGNNGVVSGATLGNDRFGVANKAYRFNDGNNITVTNSTSLSLTNAFSVSVWVNMQSTTGRNGNNVLTTDSEQCIFTKNCDAGQLRNAIYPQANGTFLLQTWANNGDQIAIPFQLNQWKLISLTYDGTTLKQFVNGNLVSTKAVALSLVLSNNYNLVIGNMGCYVYFFNGFIDEFRMYNRGLSNSEVLDIYNAEKP